MRRRAKLWVVRSGDGRTVAEIVARAGEDPTHAIAEGRVFVERRRVVRGDELVRAGVRVSIAPAAASAESPSNVTILFSRGDLVACVKPAGIPTVPDHGGASHSLVHVVRRLVSADELFVTSRLDRDVSGVVVFARTRQAEQRLREARARGAYARRYVALATSNVDHVVNVDQQGYIDQRTTPPGTRRAAPEAPPQAPQAPQAAQGRWTAPIGRSGDARLRAVAGVDAKAAETRWRVVARAGPAAMLAVEPVTGRTHQIRVHASHAGMPLLGDRDYGGARNLTLAGGRVVALERVALHAARVVVPGSDGAPVVAEAPIPPELASLWTELGGEAEAWNTAASCSTADASPLPFA